MSLILILLPIIALMVLAIPVLLLVILPWSIFRDRRHRAKRPLGVRFGDAMFLGFFSLYGLGTAFIASGFADFNHLSWNYNVNQQILSLAFWCYIGLAIALIICTLCLIFDHRRTAITLFITALLSVIPLQWFQLGAISYYNSSPSQGYLWAVNSVPQAQTYLDGKPLVYPDTFPPLHTRIQALGQITAFRPKWTNTGAYVARPDIKPDPLKPFQSQFTDAVEVRLGQYLWLQAADQYLLINPLDASLKKTPSRETGYGDRPIHLMPSPMEFNRRFQPILAWAITHPTQTAAGPLVAKAESDLYLAEQYKRLPDRFARPLQLALVEHTFNGGKPISPSRRVKVLNQVFDRIRTEVTSQPSIEPTIFSYINAPIYVGHEAFPFLVPSLTPAELSKMANQLVASDPGNDPTQVFVLGNTSYTVLDAWLTGNQDPVKLKAVQDALGPAFAHKDLVMGLSRLSGPHAAKYFEDRLVIQATDPNALKWTLMWGAGMSGPEGKKFRADHAEQIAQALLEMRRERQIDFQLPPNLFQQRAFGPVPEPGQPEEPVRDLYIKAFLKNYTPTKAETIKFSPVQCRFNELLWMLNETRPEPYLQVLADPRLIPKGRTWADLTRDLTFALSSMSQPHPLEPILSGYGRHANQIITAWAASKKPTPDQLAKLTQDIATQVIAHPETYGIKNPARVPPNFLADLKAQNLCSQPQDIQRLTLLFSLKTLDDTAKAQELSFAVQTGYISPGAITPLLARAEPFARKAGIDLIVRWPTPENQSTLSTLAADPDASVASYAKAGQSFIQWLSGQPLDEIPAPWGPHAISFFDLGRFEK